MKPVIASGSDPGAMVPRTTGLLLDEGSTHRELLGIAPYDAGTLVAAQAVATPEEPPLSLSR